MCIFIFRFGFDSDFNIWLGSAYGALFLFSPASVRFGLHQCRLLRPVAIAIAGSSVSVPLTLTGDGDIVLAVSA